MRIAHTARPAILWSFIAFMFAFGAGNFVSEEAATLPRLKSCQGESPSKRVEGDWEGILDAGFAKLKLVLHIVKKDAVLMATLDSPDQGATGLAIDTISVSEADVRFEIKAYGAVYEGKLTKDDAQIEGVWKQGVQTYPLVFKRPGPTGTQSLKLQRVDAGGHTLNLLVGGEAAPAVILEGGFGAGIASWSSVQNEIAKFAQVVSYDRAGLNQSQPGPKPRSAKQIALELRTALHNAGIKPPYVLVGHSMGGPYIRVFASMYPNEVAGLVLIDPSQETFDDWMKKGPLQKFNESKMKERDAQIAQASQGVRDESAAIGATYQQARSAKVPRGIPVTLLTAMRDAEMPPEAMRVWEEKHKEWIEKIPGGKHILAEKSRHSIQVDEPQLVIDAIRQVVEKVRAARGSKQ